MVYSKEDISMYSIGYGQERRDLIRISRLISLGYNVYSIDDKHNAILGQHCRANFNDSRRLYQSIKKQKAFPEYLVAQYIILDYFFSPVFFNITL